MSLQKRWTLASQREVLVSWSLAHDDDGRTLDQYLVKLGLSASDSWRKSYLAP